MRPSPLPRPHEGPSSIVCVSVFPGCLSFPARFASLGRKRERERERERERSRMSRLDFVFPYLMYIVRVDVWMVCHYVYSFRLPGLENRKMRKSFQANWFSTCSYLVRWMYCTSVGRYSSRFFFLLSLMTSQVIFIITYKWFEYIL